MSGYKVSQTSEETFESTVDCDDNGKSECQSQSSWGVGCADMGLWVAVIVLIIIWTLAVWVGWSWFSSGNNRQNKGKDCDDKQCDGFGGGCIGAGLLWLIILIFFVGAAWRCGWGAVVGFLVFFLIILLIGWWWMGSC